jgi:hypothetical protein
MNHYVSFETAMHQAASQSFGMPDERLARVAARRAFVEMKHAFMRAAADIDGGIGELLQRKVRSATEAVELWRLRAVLLASLAAHHERTPLHRWELHRQLDSVFPEHGTGTGCVPL